MTTEMHSPTSFPTYPPSSGDNIGFSHLPAHSSREHDTSEKYSEEYSRLNSHSPHESSTSDSLSSSTSSRNKEPTASPSAPENPHHPSIRKKPNHTHHSFFTRYTATDPTTTTTTTHQPPIPRIDRRASFSSLGTCSSSPLLPHQAPEICTSERYESQRRTRCRSTRARLPLWLANPVPESGNARVRRWIGGIGDADGDFEATRSVEDEVLWRGDVDVLLDGTLVTVMEWECFDVEVESSWDDELRSVGRRMRGWRLGERVKRLFWGCCCD
ncbi:hypothetical protein M3J09_004865 [Ascochyta lentis]